MKTQAKHTPGPWYATGIHVQSAVINEDNYVCEVEGDTPEQAQANARLIAAAPALLEALQATLTKLDHALGTDCECDNTTKANKTTCIQCIARAAIHNATKP